MARFVEEILRHVQCSLPTFAAELGRTIPAVRVVRIGTAGAVRAMFGEGAHHEGFVISGRAGDGREGGEGDVAPVTRGVVYASHGVGSLEN